MNALLGYAAALLLLGTGAVDDTAAQTHVPGAIDIAGCAPWLDVHETLALLRLELGTTSAGPSAPATPELRIRCASPGQIVVIVGDRAPEQLSLGELANNVRARTLALAIAERFRQATAAPVAPPGRAEESVAASVPAVATPAVPATPAVAPPTPVPGAAMPAPLPRIQAAAPENTATGPVQPPVRRGPTRNERRRQLAGKIALGLFVPSAAGFIAGAPVVAIGDTNADKPAYRVAGAWLLSAATFTLVGSAVSFGIWLREQRRRPAPEHK